MLKKVLLWVLGIFIAIQLIPVNRVNKPVDKKDNFVDVFATPAQVKVFLKNACYDCHSNETVYPWYSKVAPISWTVKDHINEGRERLNFSEWNSFNKDQKKTILQHSITTLQQRTMPMPAYMLKHPEANLTNDQRKTLEDYFQGLLSSGQY